VAVGELHTRFKATGMELDEIWAYVWTVRDGKATAMQSYTDPREALEAAAVGVGDVAGERRDRASDD
jgi:ketosteroid isomerase-like protein